MKRKPKITDEKHIHDGHRARLIHTAYTGGLDHLSQVQVMELFLFFVHPRCDTNPIAHRLLDKFGSFSAVLDACFDDLLEVDGMGLSSVEKMLLLVKFIEYYEFDKMFRQQKVNLNLNFLSSIEKNMRCKTKEEAWAFGVNRKGDILLGRKFGEGDSSQVNVNVRELALYLTTNRVNRAIVVHNHPDGLCKATKQDEVSYKNMERKFDALGCELIDSLIVGSNGIYSTKRECALRTFSESEEFIEDICAAFGIFDDDE